MFFVSGLSVSVIPSEPFTKVQEYLLSGCGGVLVCLLLRNTKSHDSLQSQKPSQHSDDGGTIIGKAVIYAINESVED